MKNNFEHTYSIKRFTKTSDDFVNALKIYSDNIPYEVKTVTNEISYWLNNTSDIFEVNVFGLYLDKTLIGFAMTSYLRSSKIMVDDYLEVKPEYRFNTIFLNYMGLIQNFYSENGYDISFCVTEISNKYNGNSINKESRVSLKLLCLEEYSKVNALYVEPELGLDNSESEFEAYLYIKNLDSVSIINKQTYLNIVHSIYYDYYYNWYVPILNTDELNIYRRKLEQLYKRISESIEANDTLALIKNDCSVFQNKSNYNETTAGSVPAQQKINNSILLVKVFVLIAIIPLISAAWIKILSFVGVGINESTSLIGSSIAALISGLFAYIIALNSK